MAEYLGKAYRLAPVSTEKVVSLAAEFGFEKLQASLEDVMADMLPDPHLVSDIYARGIAIQNTYREGGGIYVTAAAVSVAALLSTNPGLKLRHSDWDKADMRDEGLRRSPLARTLEMMTTVGLTEIRAVHETFAEGIEQAFVRPNLAHMVGFSSLGALHAHDAAHFALQG